LKIFRTVPASTAAWGLLQRTGHDSQNNDNLERNG
jgi:hypothetical protein